MAKENRPGPVLHNRGIQSIRSSDFHDFGFFANKHFIDFLDVLIGFLLDVVQSIQFLIFGDVLVLQKFLDVFVGIAADISNSHTSFFGDMFTVTDQIPASFFVLGRLL